MNLLEVPGLVETLSPLTRLYELKGTGAIEKWTLILDQSRRLVILRIDVRYRFELYRPESADPIIGEGLTLDDLHLQLRGALAYA